MKKTIFLTLMTLLFLGMIAYALPTETFVELTEDNNTFVSQNWFYVNITSDEDLTSSKLEVGNDTGGFINFTMTNSSLTNWYLNTTNQDDGEYNYTVWLENTTGQINQSNFMVITLDTINPVVNSIDTITDAQVSQSVLYVNGTCIDTNIDSAYTNTSEYNTTDSAGAIFNFSNTGISLTTKRYDILVTCNDSAGNTGTKMAYYYYVGSDHYMVLGEDYTLARLFSTDQTSVYTDVPIQINGTETSSDTYNHTINSTQDWTSLNLNFTPMTIGSGHNSYLYIEGSGEVSYFDDSEDCESVGTDKIKCTGTGINVDAIGSGKFVSYTTDITLSAPADNLINTSTNDTQAFVFTMTNTYDNTLPCSLVVDDNIYYTNSSTVDSIEMSFYSNTSLTNASHTWYIECGGYNSTVRTLTIDNVAPVIDTYSYENITTGALSLDYTVNESDTDSTCTFYLYNNGTTDTVTGIWNQTTGSIRDCEYNVTASDMTYEGYFIVGVVVTDTMGNTITGTNQTNFTSTKLYTGYTQVQIDRNMTTSEFSAMNENIISLHYYNNTGKSFINYVVGLSTNEDVQLYDGDSAFVRTLSDTSMVRKLTYGYATERNISLTLGWNQASAWNQTAYPNLENLCDETVDLPITAEITSIAWWESVNQKYTSHTCGFSINNEDEIPLGQGYFVRVNATTTMGRYR